MAFADERSLLGGGCLLEGQKEIRDIERQGRVKRGLNVEHRPTFGVSFNGRDAKME
jgi:hypothetical protein